MSDSADTSASAAPEGYGQIRQRTRRSSSPSTSSGKTQSSQDASQIVRELNGDPKQKKTYGRTPDGTVFIVPTTHDMVSQLLDPRQPKNISDFLVLAVLSLHILAAWLLPSYLKQPVFATLFALWRTSYNLGIGYLLTVQSNRRLLVTWANKLNLFVNPETGHNPRPWLYHTIKREMETKIPEDYDFEKTPIEYNTWLVFRRFVDLILMCDFVSYCLYAIVCSHKPEGESIGLALLRWGAGIALFGFNLWVKLDAHRVVKDYAWYWGDFFYLVDQELTFDGVFELAPHPMYSIGYAGYYGISLMAASYNVLFISIMAHAAQFAFLQLVENPHIEKTYNSPPPRSRMEIAEPQVEGTVPGPRDAPTPVHNLLGFKHLDLFRTTDYAVLLILGNFTILTYVTPATPWWKTLFVAHALIWRLWHSVGLGIILTKQSKNKMFTRHFVKYGESAEEAWRQWKSMYHISLILCHSSFIAACWKMYSFQEDWSYGWVVIKYVVGLGLLALHMWTSMSIYESLGEFGWFYGDFFFENTGKLTYTSIYRFLNNPERVIGTAGLWGAALITWSRTIFALALIGHTLTLGFISRVEKPHMQKIYGRKIREEAGVTKFLKRSLPPPVKDLQTTVDHYVGDATGVVNEFFVTAQEMLAKGSSKFAQDYTALFNKYPARLTLTRITPDLAGFDEKNYSLAVEGALLAGGHKRVTGKEVPGGQEANAVYEYGAPIRLTWTAQANHSKKDWIGLYMLIDNKSKDKTEVSSQGRWVPTCPGWYDPINDKGILVWDQPVTGSSPSDVPLVQGKVIFEGDKLWWTQGTFEFRYHHNGDHSVLAISDPFVIGINQFDEEDSRVGADTNGAYEAAVAERLLPVVRNCLDRDPDIAPNTVDEPFGDHVRRDGKYARRVVYAIRHMFGVEFAPAVVPADGNVRKLSWRICNAKQVLAPYSMSLSKGPTTPTTEAFPEKL